MLRKVHEYQRVPNTTEVRLVRTTPYVRLRGSADDPPLFIQGGQVYSEGGQIIADPPAWFWDELAKVSDGTLREVGWTARRVGSERERSPAKVVAATAAGSSRTYTCTVEGCGAVMPLRLKGIHAARHRRTGNI
jgi:hypothetical protein